MSLEDRISAFASHYFGVFSLQKGNFRQTTVIKGQAAAIHDNSYQNYDPHLLKYHKFTWYLVG